VTKKKNQNNTLRDSAGPGFKPTRPNSLSVARFRARPATQPSWQARALTQGPRLTGTQNRGGDTRRRLLAAGDDSDEPEGTGTLTSTVRNDCYS
jgi:hypothetical protein